MNIFRILIILIISLTAVDLSQSRGQRVRVPLDRISHIHGLAVATSQPPTLYLATHEGLFLARPEGDAEPASGLKGDVMSFIAHPKAPRTFYASGHPPQGGNLGVLLSSDGGKKWRKISEGDSAHTGFHLMEISKADTNVLYGVSSVLNVSKDGGKSWREIGPIPEGLIDLAASSVSTETLFAATRKGLFVSRDQGANWKPAHDSNRPSTMVHVSKGGGIYAFIVGVGLVRARESDLSWQSVSERFDDRNIIRLTLDPADPRRLYAATITGAVMMSRNGGKTWIGFEGSHNAKPEIITKGKKIYDTHCQACHGVAGKGQHPKTIDPKNPPKIPAPALDNSAHAWHHSDKNLVSSILNGSPRKGSPMVAWKNQLSRDDAESIVAYIKSLWSFRSLACQGARHMACMGHR